MLGDDDKTQDRTDETVGRPQGWTPSDGPATDLDGQAVTPGEDPPAAPDLAQGATPDQATGTPAAPPTGPLAPPPGPGPLPGAPFPPPGWGAGSGWNPAAPQQPPAGWPPRPVGWQQPGQWQAPGQPPQQPGQWQQPVWRPQVSQQPGWQQGQWQAPGQPPQHPGQWQQPATWLAPTTVPAGGRRRPGRLPAIVSVIAACLLSFSGGMVFDHFAFAPSTTATAQPTSATDGTGTTPSLYLQAEKIIKQYFVGRSSVTDQQLLYGALKGMVEALGDTGHSVFLTPSQYKSYQASLNATVAGIGVLMSTGSGAFTISKVLAGSPAAQAGLEAGDQITAVDGESVAGLTIDDLGTKIRGQVGTSVKITVIRTGVTAPIDFTITRAQVSVPLVGWGIIPGTHIADIALVEFSQGASDQLAAAIAAATDAGATSVILDLRGNPGGYAAEATDVASQFLSGGTVYIEQDASGAKTSITVNTKVKSNDLPLVVLVDHDSASSSEIVAGALQDNKRAKIVGVATYGTGTVLQEFRLDDGSVIFLGTAYWLTPSGAKIFGKGITPDQVVTMAAGAVPLDPTTFGSMTTSQLNSSGDAQLLAAIAAITK